MENNDIFLEGEESEKKELTTVEKVNKFFEKPLHKIILVLFLLGLVFVVVYLLMNIKNDIETVSTTEEIDVYYYIDDEYNEYSGKLTVDRNNNITGLSDNKTNWDSVTEPIYYKNEDIVIFPKSVSLVRPTLGFRQNKITYFTKIQKTNTYPKLVGVDLDMEIANAFIYDGINTYFFLDNTTLTLKKEKIELPPFSYARCGYKDYCYIYNYETKEMKAYKDMDYMVYAESNGYKINLSTDNLSIGDQSIILTKNIDKLTDIK